MVTILEHAARYGAWREKPPVEAHRHIWDTGKQRHGSCKPHDLAQASTQLTESPPPHDQNMKEAPETTTMGRRSCFQAG